MLRTILLMVAVMLCGAGSNSLCFGALIISGFNVPNVETFNGVTMANNGAATTPGTGFDLGDLNWATTWTDQNPGGFYSRTDSYSNANSARILRDNALSIDRGWGGKLGAGETTRFMTLNITNGTGATITDIAFTTDYLQVSSGLRATTIAFDYRIGAGAFTTAGIVGASGFTATTGTTPAQLASTAVTNRVFTLSGLTLANGASADLRFSFATGVGSDENAHIGISNFSITAVPEPSSIALVSLMGCTGLVAAYRRRKAKLKVA